MKNRKNVFTYKNTEYNQIAKPQIMLNELKVFSTLKFQLN